MVGNDKNWNWALLDNLLPMTILWRLAAIKCPLPSFPLDSIGWARTSNRVFSVKLAYAIRRGAFQGPEEDVWKLIQRFRGTQRMEIFLWVVCMGRIMTNQERVRRHFSDDASCHLCGDQLEDIDPVLRRCPNAFIVWRELVQPSLFAEFMNMGTKQWIRMNLNKGARFGHGNSNWDLLFGGTCWYLWLYRNVMIFDSWC
ncbi:hypothetical protein V6N13_006072 [Hibiscus sabdariffa]